jgi:LuxR family transcriptional regulator
MVRQMTPQDIENVSPAGHYVALRIGFAFPMEEINALPCDWIDHYTKNRLMLFDPVMRWAYYNTGIVRWSDLRADDPHGVLTMAGSFGLRFGLTVAVSDVNIEGHRSFASFARADREFKDLEMLPPINLTAAELEALAMVKDGQRLKQIAYNLGVTEGAVKQRLKNAKIKLGANTSTQAATMARQFKLI